MELMMELADDLQAVVKGVVVIADNGGVDATLMMSFSSKKMRDRSRFYAKGSDFKDLHKALGKDVLPEEYGGNAGPIQKQIDMMKGLLLDNKTWIQDQTKFKTDESKRITRRGYADIFGM